MSDDIAMARRLLHRAEDVSNFQDRSVLLLEVIAYAVLAAAEALQQTKEPVDG